MIKLFYNEINEILNNNNFNLLFNNPKIEKFPPNKENLVVITFNPNKDALLLFKLIYDKIDNGEHVFENWIPHITIGKLRDKNTDLTTVIKDLFNNLDESFISNSIYLAGNIKDNYNALKWTF